MLGHLFESMRGSTKVSRQTRSAILTNSQGAAQLRRRAAITAATNEISRNSAGIDRPNDAPRADTRAMPGDCFVFIRAIFRGIDSSRPSRLGWCIKEVREKRGRPNGHHSRSHRYARLRGGSRRRFCHDARMHVNRPQPQDDDALHGTLARGSTAEYLCVALKYIMAMLTLRQLRYLDALARHGHFGRAAEECAVSQPALSMQIRELENELGAKLVERQQGATALTEIGREVARRAAGILNATRDLTDSARHSARPLTGGLRLGVIPTLAPYVLPRILPELQRRHPELRLELIESQTQTLLSELGRGALDTLLLALPLDKPDFETLPLFEDCFLLAVPADDPLSERARVSPRDVRARRLILLKEGYCLHDQTLGYGILCAPPDAGLGATSLATIMQMVANGYGVTVVPEVAIDVEVRDKRIKLLRFAEPQPRRTVGLAWRPTSARKADFAAIGRIIVETLRTVRPRPRTAPLSAVS